MAKRKKRKVKSKKKLSERIKLRLFMPAMRAALKRRKIKIKNRRSIDEVSALFHKYVVLPRKKRKGGNFETVTGYEQNYYEAPISGFGRPIVYHADEKSGSGKDSGAKLAQAAAGVAMAGSGVNIIKDIVDFFKGLFNKKKKSSDKAAKGEMLMPDEKLTAEEKEMAATTEKTFAQQEQMDNVMKYLPVAFGFIFVAFLLMRKN